MCSDTPIHPGLFTWPSASPELLGSRCQACGEHAFPAQADCRSCGAGGCEVVGLGDRGTLWTWTIQGFLPKVPYAGGETEATFRAYGVGYVELACGLRVESRLHESDPGELAIGQPMRLVIEPFGPEGRMIFAFKRDQGGAAA